MAWPMKIPVAKIMRNPKQPRTVFDRAELQSLADSLVKDGLINPIGVEGPDQDGNYTLVDGERRWRAARMSGWTEIEANVRQPLNGRGDKERLVLAMVANLQRADMGPVDEARAYHDLAELSYTQAEIANRVGRSQSMISQKLRLLEFPQAVQKAINNKSLPIDERANGSLRRLSPAQQESVAKLAGGKKLSATQVMSICARISRQKTKPPQKQKLQPSECPPLAKYQLLGKYQLVDHLIKRTCKSCGLFDQSGISTICPSCPMMFFTALAGIERKREDLAGQAE